MRLMAAWLVVVCLGCGGVKSRQDDDDGSQGDDLGDDNGDDGADGNGQDAGGGGNNDGAPADAGPVSAACAEPPACGSAGEVGSVADIAAIAAQCPLWGDADIDRFRRRTPTFLATQPISVCPGDFAPPDDCDTKKEPICNSGIFISVDPRLAGAAETAACNGAQFEAGTRFRVRFNLEPPSLVTSFLTPHIHFERPCDTGCEDDERACEANGACYLVDRLRPDNYCFQCGFGLREECACLTPDITVLPDCTECEFTYGDQVFLGLCLQGNCDTTKEVCNTCPCE
jgi:hypothetical protein